MLRLKYKIQNTKYKMQNAKCKIHLVIREHVETEVRFRSLECSQLGLLLVQECLDYFHRSDYRNSGFMLQKGSKTCGRERSMVVAREGSAVGTGIFDLRKNIYFKRCIGLVLD